MAIRYTKDRQRVWNFYQDPIRFHPAKVREFGLIKIKTYPQETANQTETLEQRNDYSGLLITINIRRPRWKPIGWFHFDLHINNGTGIFKQLKTYRYRLKKLGQRTSQSSTESTQPEEDLTQPQIINPVEDTDSTESKS